MDTEFDGNIVQICPVSFIYILMFAHQRNVGNKCR